MDAGLDEARYRAGEIVRPRRRGGLVADHVDSAAGGSPQDLRHEVIAAGAVEPADANDVVARQQRDHVALPGELRGAVLVERPRRVVLDVRFGLRAVEDFVGADVDHGGVAARAGLGDVPRALCVHGEREFRLALAAGGIGERGGVDHDVRRERVDGRDGRVRVGDVQVAVR